MALVEIFLLTFFFLFLDVRSISVAFIMGILTLFLYV